MDKQDVDNCAVAEEGAHLNRNRSFKTKQLVRSQAIRESTSPPRTVSPSVRNEDTKNVNKVNVKVTAVERTTSDSSHDSDAYSYSERKDRRKPVEIQITQGAWDENPPYESRGRTKRWLSDTSRDSTRDLLSNNPRVACVCGACAACPQCRGRRRRHICTIKQDSGIGPDECPDCSDTEHNGANNDSTRKSSSLDVDDQYYCRCPERRDKPKSMLSRSDSDDKSEPTGPELVYFIKETLNKSGKDRMTLLKVEKELYSLVNDTGRCIVKFPVMTSYGRMLVHRCAALFQLSHHLDHSNKNCVIVSKSGTSGGRIPCTNFKTWCVANFPPPSPQRHHPEIIDGANAKSILKRDTHSLDEPSSGALAMNRSKSLEQREKEYERVRRRIFSTDNCNPDESQWPWLNAGPVKLLAPDPGRNKLLKVQSLENSVPPQNWRGRSGVVSKSHSFGGYGEPQPTGRALSRQGDLASSSWRLSPSSSGYKTLSLRSTDSVTPSPTGGGTPEPTSQSSSGALYSGVVWAVTDMACVPAGAAVLHPQTLRPLTNPDGSIYHFDPNNPPILYDPGEYEEVGPPKTVEQSNEKRRGRLEKQHSFIDHEAECQQPEQYHYEYDVHETRENPTEKDTSKPVTPTKYEPVQPQEATNQIPEAIEPANQTLERVEPTNQREVKAGSYQDTVYYGPYASLNQHPYTEQVQSPPQMTQYIQPDVTTMNMQNVMPQAKVTSILQDPNIRTMALTNVVYPSNIPHGYQYVPNPPPCRPEPLQQQLIRYQPATLLQQQIEEQKVPTPPQQTQDNTFRIDPSYPYAPVDYTTTYGACVDPMPNQPQPQRSYSVPYNPAEMAPMPGTIPSVYPLGNVIPPQLIQYPLQYQDSVQWTPVQTPAMCPVLYPQHYAHYNIVYPQVVTQPYPVCQPLYSVVDNRRKRNSLPSSTRVTPIITTPEEKPYEKFDRQNSEIAARINQIKEGLIQREGMKRDDWKRNSGNGILGSYPVNNFNGRISGTSDKVHLTPTARAIVDSLRHLQARNTYHQDRRYEYNSYQRNYDRSNYRRYDRDEINGKGDGNNVHNKEQDKNSNNPDRNSHNPDRNSHNLDRNSHNPDRNSHNPDRNSHNPDRNSHFPDRNSHNPDRNSNTDRNTNTNYRSYQDKNDTRNNIGDTNSYQEKSNVQDTKSNTEDKTNQDKYVQERQNVQEIQVQNTIQERTQCNVQDRGNTPDWSQSNVQDRTLHNNVQNRTQSNIPDKTQSNVPDRTQSHVADRTQSNVPDRTQSHVADRTQSNVPDRTQSHVADRTQSNVPDRTQSHVADRTQSNVVDRTQSHVADRTQSNVVDRTQSHVADRTQSNVPDRTQSHVADRTQSNVPDRTQSHVADRTQSNVVDRTQSHVADRTQSNVPDRTQSHIADRTQSNVPNRTQSNVPDRTQSHVADRTQSHVPDRTQSNVADRTHHDRTNQEPCSYPDRGSYQDRGSQGQDRPWQERKFGPRGMNPGQYQYRPSYLLRQMSPATWCRRSPAPVHPGLPHPRRPYPDNRTGRRY